MKKTKKKTLAKLKKDLWNLCREIIRKKYKNNCYTCSASDLQGSNWQTGHGKQKSILNLKYQYDLRNIRPQCYGCNVTRNGMTDIFITKLEKENEGREFLEETCIKTNNGWEIKHQSLMGSIEAYIFITNKIKEYANLLSKM